MLNERHIKMVERCAVMYASNVNPMFHPSLQEVYEVVCEDIHAKENQLNKLIYAKKRKMKALFNLQVRTSDPLSESNFQYPTRDVNYASRLGEFFSSQQKY